MLQYLKNKAFLFHKKLIFQESNKKHQRILKMFLYLVSLIWKLIAYLKNFLFSHKIIPSYSLKIPVISIGNIVAGGTGKTPLTIKLLQRMSLEKKIVLLSRGYGTKIKRYLIAKPKDDLTIGDEPALIKKKFPNLYCFLGKRRLDLAILAENKKMDLIIIDDGLQYRQINRDFEIITMNAFDLFGKNYYLPRGLLRDCPARLKDADLICVNYIKDKKHYLEICSILKNYCTCPIVGMNPSITIVEYGSEKILSTPLKGGVFCGIAHPHHFANMLAEKGIEAVSFLELNDHEKITEKDLLAFCKKCQKLNADYLICTEKDFIEFPSNLDLPIAIAKMELNICFGDEHWELMIEKIQSRMNNSPVLL